MGMLYGLLIGMVIFFACYEAIYVYRRLAKTWDGRERMICIAKVPVLAMLVCMLVCMINCVVDFSVMSGF
ncbi:hypothetical protein CO110_02335 [Candidatus Desantisbacteria bacterium CG_4_9_14_3_um_filter_40_11]|uniref:Uncharacterized protein n=1 Tax=Candidatus Desantisbacteria bacterium CG_4_9_14_3_um_filter_40_11 TaxID=1974546 RepID=A0A2M8AVZ1_9BACT|nr:MAG: hypothetical protein CO110_02335 [Candidatus Desantisbacteria bacterium CG_4_9_14_3_um_filter_40_11]